MANVACALRVLNIFRRVKNVWIIQWMVVKKKVMIWWRFHKFREISKRLFFLMLGTLVPTPVWKNLQLHNFVDNFHIFHHFKLWVHSTGLSTLILGSLFHDESNGSSFWLRAMLRVSRLIMSICLLSVKQTPILEDPCMVYLPRFGTNVWQM